MRQLVLIAACALALAACAGEDDSSDLDIRDGRPTPSATTSSGAPKGSLLDYVPAKPTEPAQSFDEKSAVAFAEYWFRLAFYAYGQDDATPLQAVSDPGCRGCQKAFTNLKNQARSGFVLIGEGPPTLAGSKVDGVDGKVANVTTTLSYPRVTVIDAKTGKQSGKWVDAASGKTTISLLWDEQDGWSVLDFRDVY